MSQSKYNESLKNRHEELRESTVKQVTEAIDMLKELEGENVILSATKLTKVTNLSRSVFYKPHILKLWNRPLWHKRYGRENLAKNEYEKHINEISIKNRDLETKVVQLQQKVKALDEELKRRKKVYRDDLKEWENHESELLGEILSLKQKMRAAGLQL